MLVTAVSAVVGEHQQEGAEPLGQPGEIQQDSPSSLPGVPPYHGLGSPRVTPGLCWGLRADARGVRAVFFQTLAIFLIFLSYSSSFGHPDYPFTISFVLWPDSLSFWQSPRFLAVFLIFWPYSSSFGHIPYPLATFFIFLGYSLSFGIFLILWPYRTPRGAAQILGAQQLLSVPPATFPRCCSNPCPGWGRSHTQQFLIPKIQIWAWQNRE